MDRNQILEKAKDEKNDFDEREKQIVLNASKYAKVAGGVICMIFAMINQLLCHRTSPEMWSIYSIMLAVENIYVYSKIKNKKYIVFGIVFLIMAALYIIISVIEIIEGRSAK